VKHSQSSGRTEEEEEKNPSLGLYIVSPLKRYREYIRNTKTAKRRRKNK
jgi:hypothetical protein